MLESSPTRLDMVHTIPELGLQPGLVSDTLHSGYASTRSHTAASTDAQVQAGALPPLSLASTSTDSRWWSGALAVTKDLAKGAYKEMTEHPLHFVESAAIGVGVGIGAAFASPGVIAAVAAAGGAYAGYELDKNAGSWLHEVEVVAHEKDYTADETAKAHAGLEGVGAGIADITAGVAGGAVATYVFDSIVLTSTRGAAMAASPDAPPVAEAPATTQKPVAAEVPWKIQGSMAAEAPLAEETLPAVEPESLVGDAEKVLFTVDDTTMAMAYPLNWALAVNANGKDAYGAATLRFANRWVTVMEEQIAAGKPLEQGMVDGAEQIADTEGISGHTYSFAKYALYRSWKYGAELKAILDSER